MNGWEGRADRKVGCVGNALRVDAVHRRRVEEHLKSQRELQNSSPAAFGRATGPWRSATSLGSLLENRTKKCAKPSSNFTPETALLANGFCLQNAMTSAQCAAWDCSLGVQTRSSFQSWTQSPPTLCLSVFLYKVCSFAIAVSTALSC